MKDKHKLNTLMNYNDVTYKQYIEISQCKDMLQIMDILDTDDILDLQFLKEKIPYIDIKKNYGEHKLKKDFTKLSASDYIKIETKIKEHNIPECLSILSGIPVDELLNLCVIDVNALIKWYLNSFILFIRILQSNISGTLDDKQKEVFDMIISEFENIIL